MTDKMTERFNQLRKAIDKAPNPDFARLEVFVEFLDDIGITPRFILEDVTNNVLGVQLEIRAGQERTTSKPLPTEIPMRAINVDGGTTI